MNSILFWDNSWSGKGNYVNYDTELKPNKKSEDFWFEIDGTSEIWIVAKNEENGIEYLQVIKDNDNKFDLEITADKDIDPVKEQIAQELTAKTDKKEQIGEICSMGKYSINRTFGFKPV